MGPNYKELHSQLDLIVAIWIDQRGGMPSQNSVLDLLTWYFEQRQKQVDQESKSKTVQGE